MTHAALGEDRVVIVVVDGATTCIMTIFVPVSIGVWSVHDILREHRCGFYADTHTHGIWKFTIHRLRGPDASLGVSSLLLDLLFFIAYLPPHVWFFFFFNDPAPPEIYPLPLHAAFPI